MHCGLDEVFMSSDIEEVAEEADNMASCHAQKNNSPPHHRSFKPHVHFGKVKRKVSAPGDNEHLSSSHNNNNNNSPGNGFSDILEWLRPRAFSDYSKNRRRSSGDAGSTSSGHSRNSGPSSAKHSDEGFHSSEDVNLPLFVDTKMANAWVNTIPQEYLYRRSMSISSEPFVVNKHCHRQRSNSEYGRYLIMRRSKDPDGINEFVGRLEDNGELAYCQLLASMKCYDLMPQLGKMVVLDSELPVRKAFMALVNNWIKSAIVLDSETNTVLGVLTVTDFMNMLLDMSAKKTQDVVDMPLSTGLGYEKTSKRQQPIVAYADHSVYQVAKILCHRRLHRLIVFDSEHNGDPLFLLSKKMILKSLQKFIARLPMPRCMHIALDELQLRLGTWTEIITVKRTTTIHKALLKFLGKTLSCLPVMDDNQLVVDVLTKSDVMNLIVDEGPSESILQKTVQDALQSRPEGVEKLVTCHKKTTLMLAVECLLLTDVHRLVVVNTNGGLEGIISVSDLTRFLIGSSSSSTMSS